MLKDNYQNQGAIASPQATLPQQARQINQFVCRLLFGLALILGINSIVAAETQPKESPYKDLIPIEDKGQGVVYIHPKLNPLNYDGIYLDEISISYHKDTTPLSPKHENKIKQTLFDNEIKWIKQNGVNPHKAPQACVVTYKMRVSSISFDKSKLKNSQKFRYKVYGSMVISVEIQEPETGNIIAIWIQKVALATGQKDRGNADRKIVKSLIRTVEDAVEVGYESYTTQTEAFARQAKPAEGCTGELLASSNFKRD